MARDKKKDEETTSTAKGEVENIEPGSHVAFKLSTGGTAEGLWGGISKGEEEVVYDCFSTEEKMNANEAMPDLHFDEDIVEEVEVRGKATA